MSRVDTETDKRLPEGHALRGKAAVANAKLAYQLFRERFSGPRWDALAAQGRAPAAPAVGVDLHQEPGVLVHSLRRRADRPRHREHAGAASIEALHDGEGNQRADTVTEGVDAACG